MNDQLTQLALCTESASQATLAALCTELHPAEGQAPEWVELLPAGEKVQGVDGRAWLNDQPQAVADAFNRPIPLDWEHATELKAPKGEPAPAAGWIEEVQIRDGATWGRVAWTPKGQQAVAEREYRYLSPAFLHEKASGRILKLINAGLTNRPNLNLTALNRAETPPEEAMDEKLLAALGLPKDATAEQAHNAVTKMKADHETALNTAQSQAKTPSLDEYVPRPDYDKALNQAKEAATKLAQRDKAEQEAEIETAINAAIQEGKITPATKDFYLASCRADGGLEKFQEFVKAAPVVGGDSGLDGKQPGSGENGLTKDQLAICSAMSIEPEEYKKAL